MFNKEIEQLGSISIKKVDYMKRNFIGFLVLSILAGVFVGIGSVLIGTIGGILKGSVFTKIMIGITFSVALSLVVMAGGELFTGNNLVLSVGVMSKKISTTELIKYWFVCYIGNWIGSVILAYLFYKCDFVTGDIEKFIYQTAVIKTNIPFFALLVRGILCNFLVCIGIWCSNKMSSESGKLIMIFWCIFAFATIGFEHCVANMTLLTLGIFEPMVSGVSFMGYFYNIFTVTLGNIIGGVVFVAMPYYVASLKENS